MSMDIKINYGTLDAIVDELSGYLTNIDKMRSALTNLNILIERSEGDSIDALWESYTTTLDKLSIFEERISDLRTLIYDYTEAMTREIQPLRRGDDTRADSYDTYWSLMLLNPYLPRFNYVQIAAYDTQGTNETQQAQYQANLNKLDALSTTLKRNVEGAKERLWELHEKVARYEQTDNEFCSRAQQLYVQYTDMADRYWDRWVESVDRLGSFLDGIEMGITNIIIGVLSFAAFLLLVTDTRIMYLKTIGLTPDFINEFIDGNFEGIGLFLSDPQEAIFGMMNDFTDTFDEDPAYAIGTLVPDIASLFIPGGIAVKGVRAFKMVRTARQAGDGTGMLKHFDNVMENSNVEMGGSIEGIPRGSLSNVEARIWYLEKEESIAGQIDRSLPLENQARQAFSLRNQYRTQARELMADRDLANSLDVTDPNLIWDEAVQIQINRGLSGDEIYKAIIESSQRSRLEVNKKLGL